MTKAQDMVEILDRFTRAKNERARLIVLASFVEKLGCGSPFIFAHQDFDEFDNIGIRLFDSDYAGKFILVGSGAEPVKEATNILVGDLVNFSRYAYKTLTENGVCISKEHARVIKEWKKIS